MIDITTILPIQPVVTDFNLSETYIPPKELYVSHVFETEFERTFDGAWIHLALKNNFHKIMYPILAGYLIVVFSLKRYMANREPFDLRKELFAWNCFLAAFSWIGAVRTMSELLAVGWYEGFEGTLCHPGHTYGATGLWLLLFVSSKVPEFVDTIFIVLRKRPLIFLHWYHHVETAFYSMWAFISPRFPVSRYFVAVNFSVHAIMYTYYALKSQNFKIPRGVSISITLLQISQMFVGLFVILSAMYTHCYNHPPALYGGLITYLIYAGMFCHFFYKAYLSKKFSKRSARATKVKVDENCNDCIHKKIT